MIQVAACDVFTLPKRQKGHGLKHMGCRFVPYTFGETFAATDSTKPDLNIGESRVWWLEAKAKATTLKIQAQGFSQAIYNREMSPKRRDPDTPGNFEDPDVWSNIPCLPTVGFLNFWVKFSGHTIFFNSTLLLFVIFLVVSLLSTMVKVNHHETTIWGTFSIFPTTLSLWRSRYSRMSPWWKNTFVYARVVCPAPLLPNVWSWCSLKVQPHPTTI